MNKENLLVAPIVLSAACLVGCSIHSYSPPAAAAPNGAAIVQTAPAATPAATPAAKPAAKRGKAVFLGARQVSFRAEKDVIGVRNAGRFRSIKLHVSGSPMALYKLKVTFANGSHFSPNTRLHFDQGSWTRTIDLPGDKRRITKVEFWYRSKRVKNGRARVQLFGVR